MNDSFSLDKILLISGSIGFLSGIIIGAKRRRLPLHFLIISFSTPMLLCATLVAIHFFRLGNRMMAIALQVFVCSALTGAVFVINFALAILVRSFLGSILDLLSRNKVN